MTTKNQQLTYSFLKMFFEQERLPKELSIPHKGIKIPNVKEVALIHIRAIDGLIASNTDLKKSRYAELNKYWLVTIYEEIKAQKIK